MTSVDVLRVVPDASVLVSAFLSPEGPSGRSLRRFIEEDAFELVLSEEIVAELKRALGDRRVRRHLNVDSKDIARLITAITLLGTFVDVPSADGDVDGDAKYLIAAQAAAPCLLVTLDPQVMESRCPVDVEIVSPWVLLELLEMAETGGNSRPIPAFT